MTYKSTTYSKRKKASEDNSMLIPDPVVEYSLYQQRIFNHMNNLSSKDKKSLAVSAAAGSGKSFTIRELVKMLLDHMEKRTVRKGGIAVFQFNKHIADEMKGKIGTHDGLDIFTVSAAGLRVLKHNKIFMRGGVKFNKYYQLAIDAVKSNLSYLSDGCPDEKSKGDVLLKKLVSQLTDIVSMTQNTLTKPGCVDEGLIMCEKYSVDFTTDRLFRVADDVIGTALEALDQGVVAFQDMVYGPIALDHDFPKYDYIFCDEIQDFSASQLELISRFCDKDTAVFGFGDPSQSIMGFTGALSDSFEQFVSKFDCRTMPLSICYRCPSKVLDIARLLVPTIRNRPDCPEGIVELQPKEWMAEKAEAGDYFICRMTAPLVGMCIALIKMRKSAIVKGREIEDKLIALYNKIIESASPPAFECADFIRALKQYRDEEMVRMIKKKSSQFKIDSFTDQTDCLKIIAEYLSAESTVNGVKDHHSSILTEIGKLFPKDVDISKHSIVLCTIHKAKGLEANRVFIIEAHKMPHCPKNKTQSTEQRQQEINIMYVAITRTKNELYIQGEGFETIEDYISHVRNNGVESIDIKVEEVEL